MKRTFKNESPSQLELKTTKRRKIDNYNKATSTCINVHKMRLCYASTLDRSKYDKCPKCLTINDYESMHFIYACIYCSYFVCNFCMADLYNYTTNLQIKLINNKSIKRQNRVVKDKISLTNTTIEPTVVNTNQRIRVGSQLLIPDNAIDKNGNPLMSHQLHTVKHIDRY
eukprot:383173_1